MTILETMQGCKVDLSGKSKLTYQKLYKSWLNILTEHAINVFRWNNLNFPQREIEILLTLVGFCGFTKFKKSNENGAVYGSMSGVTNYPDIFTHFLYATPLESGTRKIDKDLVVINNNQARVPTIIMIKNYAHLLAHTDLSIQAILINSRSGGIIKAGNQKSVDAVNQWYNSLYNGKSISVLDDDSLDTIIDAKNIEFVATPFSQRLDINDYYMTRENLLKSFYADLGISGTREKKAHLLNDEIYTDVNRVIFNVNDMLAERKLACEKINSIFKTDISVEFNYEISEQIQAMINNDQPQNVQDYVDDIADGNQEEGDNIENKTDNI